jgi:FMN-dependent oxidoreductase (nitrilotriacetate monooxygenase family)
MSRRVPKPFHLGWFTNFTTPEWNGTFANAAPPWDGRFYVDMAKQLEAACFDFIMFEDKLSISEAYGGTAEAYLKHALGMAPKHDPAPLATLVGASTNHIGVVATLSTLGYPPFLLARMCSTIDHLAGGRFGWNVVTSAEDAAAQNFGLDALPPKALRYEMADEYMDLCYQLWDSWEPGAVVMDRETATYADYTKVHPINFAGKYFKSRGPLNTVPSPQGRPTIVQAGGSPKGRRFAAKHADCIIAGGNGVAWMKSFRDDIRALAAEQGRNPDDLKVLFLVCPALGVTDDDAREKYARVINEPNFIEASLATIAAITDIDFAKYDLDQPLPEQLFTNGEQTALDTFQNWGSGKTLRQLVVDASGGLNSSIDLIGSPDTVATLMEEAMEEIGGDGFLITSPRTAIDRIQLLEVVEGLVPVLQRRGLTRNHYEHKTLRENLRAF